MRFDRCPQAWLRDQAGFTEQYLDDFQWMQRYHTLPSAGGKLDQDPRFVEAVDLIAEIRLEQKSVRK